MEIDGESTPIAPQGQKRKPADDDLESEQRLAKRFNLLSVENIKNLYIPVEQPAPVARKRSNAFSDTMNVDDSRDRIYIHDLDEEIADIESEEDRLVFMPDLEKRITKIPRSVLMGNQSANPHNEVVLYGVPESLSIPPDRDVVRKAIIESRVRAQRSQSNPQPKTSPSGHASLGQQTNGGTAATQAQSQEEDAMDIG